MLHQSYSCDKCKKIVDSQDDLKKKMRAGWDNCNTYSTRSFYCQKNFDLCKECAERLGLDWPENPSGSTPEPALADRLYDVMAELVQAEETPHQ